MLNNRFSTKGLIPYAFLAVVLVTRWSYPYTTKATEKDGEDGTKMTDLPVVNHSVPSEETFGPWVMVSGKRQASRKGNKVSP